MAAKDMDLPLITNRKQQIRPFVLGNGYEKLFLYLL
jgi:hypothetical protein